MTRDTDREFANLLQLAIDGEIDPGQGQRLQDLMRGNPERMNAWVDHFRLDSLLSNEIDRSSVVDLVDLVCPQDSSGNDVLPAVNQTDYHKRDRPRSNAWWAVTAILAVSVLFLAFLFATDRSLSQFASVATSKQLDTSIAILAQTSEDVWHGNIEPPLLLSPGRLQLESGLAEIRVYNGVTLYLEGPVDLDLITLDHAHLRHGKLRASVAEQAEGFTVTTDAVRLVDRGTEFAISAGEDGRSQVHVFDGLVDLYPSDKQTPDDVGGRAVVEGESVEVDPSFETRETEFALDRFPSAQSMDQSVANRFERWQAWSTEFAKRPDLLVYYNFEEFGEQGNGRNTVVDLASEKPINATVVGCETLTGRWPQKKALGFYNPADRLRVRIPGRWPNLTMACWVRLDELRGVNQALLLTDSFNAWQPHWQIAKEGVLKLGIGQDTVKESRRMRSPSAPLKELAPLGRWMHLATVYNSKQKTVEHYVNGIQAGSNVLPVAEPLHIGTAEIGNWLQPRQTGDEPIRNLDGRIDEFMLFRSALDAETIKEIYKAGR
ncbi:LamG-like jellyroll fold domain-containing protein [Novipirellula sp. SH528]|uniref:LamG-like jellyroll fold domain-containing protein n=1 Tax=Novipirellula sp. SH528 TaxID=3454466 RepID=UPI003FA17E5F